MSKFYTDPRTQYGNISHQATVVIQCTQDKRDMVDRMRISAGTAEKKKDYYVHGSNATLDNSVCRIDRGDLVFRLGTSSVPRGNLLNNAPPVSSCVNGLAVRKAKDDKKIDPKDEEANNLKLAEGIQVLGVSLGATTPNPDSGDGLGVKNQITVRTQGTTTLFNNGQTNFVPGDTIMWKIPTKADVAHAKKTGSRFGRNTDKILLHLTSMKMFYKNFDAGFKDMLAAKDKDDYKKNVKTSVDHFNLEMKKFVAHSIYHSARGSNQAGFVNIPFKDVWVFLDPGVDGRLGEIVDYTDANKKKIVNDVIKYINDAWDSMADDKESAVHDALHAFLAVQADAKRRVVGKCLSYSKPNTGVDCLLGTS